MSPLFGGRGRDEAETALRSCDDALAALEPGGADLGAARRLRDRAREALDARDPRGAVEAARKAEAVAKLLARLHGAASQGIVRLRIERGRMAKLGMGVEDADALIQEAAAWMGRSMERDGDPDFPAYGKAAELALEGLRLAAARVPRYKAAAAVVADAEQAVRETVASNRFVAPEAFRFFVLRPAADALEASYAKLRANAYEEAGELARSTLERAGQIRQTYGRVTEAYQGVAAAAQALRDEGATVVEVDDLLAVCRSALERGKFEDAAEVAAQAGRRLEEIHEAFRSLVLKERTAREAIAEVEQWGFDVREPRGILKSARSLMGSGRYEEAGNLLDEARTAAQGLRDTHRTTAERIAEMRRSVAAVRLANPAAAAEAEALLAKAEGLLDEGRYRQCEEDLQLASLLLVSPVAPAPPTGGARGGLGEFVDAVRAAGPACPTCGGPLAEDGSCPTCGAPAESENPEPEEVDMIQRAVDEARAVIEEIARDEAASAAEEAEARVQGCAMCGGPLDGEDVLCARCQSIVKGRAA
ncbi:MAG: hypothetical protein A3K65_01025 [Euryarchaeota archaeon RBG_16_68_12]|nr:MAG: hypothetical protein A3K65_01025 [Euryarchaeota archaeon RBG_16_68_12]